MSVENNNKQATTQQEEKEPEMPQIDYIQMLPNLVGLMLILQLDLTDVPTIYRVQIAFVISQVFAGLALLYLWYKIKALPSKKQAIVKVPPPPPSWFEPANPDAQVEEYTVKGYDMSEIRKLVKQMTMSAFISLFLGVHFEIPSVLLMQSTMTFSTLLSNPLIKLHLRGMPVERPFKEESPFSVITNSIQEYSASQTAATNQPEEAENEEHEKIQEHQEKDDSDDEKEREEKEQNEEDEKETDKEKDANQKYHLD